MITKMNNDEIVSQLNSIVSASLNSAQVYNDIEEDTLFAYLAEPEFESESRSSLVSSDVQDVVDADMPSITRTFLSTDDFMRFEPNSKNEDDIKEAEQKTKLVNHVLRNQKNSYKTFSNWFKAAELQPFSIVKYYMEEEEKVKYVPYENVSEDELSGIINSLKTENTISVDIEKTEDQPDGLYTVHFKVKSKINTFKVKTMKSEAMRISDDDEDLNENTLVGDVELITRGELLAQGYKKELIDQLQRSDQNNINSNSTLNDMRNLNATVMSGTINNWANEEVEVGNYYVKLDVDGDGIAERRFIRMSNNIILDNDPFDHVPYSGLSSILMPNQLRGRSRGQLVLETQRAKTAMLQGAANNIYAVNNPRIGVNELVNLDDVLEMELNGVIQNKGEGSPANNMYPVEIPFIAEKSVFMMNYLDQQRANRTGALATSQGLNATDITNETAARFNGTQEAGKEKIELVARNYAETGLKDLFIGTAWMLKHYQDTEMEVLILGEELKVNPSDWKYEHLPVSEVGLAITDSEDSLPNLTATLQYQMQLKANGSLLVDDEKIYNTLSKIVKAAQLGRTEEFYNDTKEDDQTLKAHNEQLNQAVLMLQEQLQQTQNPLAEAEQIKQQAFLLKAESDAKLRAAKLVEDQRQFQEKLIADMKKAQDELALKLTDMEMKYNKDLNKQVEDNKDI